MDPLKQLKEMVGLPTEGDTPLIEPTNVEVNRDLIRAFHNDALESKEAHIVASLIATYRAWYEADEQIARELAEIPPEGKKPREDD